MAIRREPEKPLLSLFWMIVSGLGFTVMSVFVKRLSPTVPQMELVFFRSLVNFVVQLALVLALREVIFPKSGKRILVFRGLMGLGGVICFFYSVAHLPLSVSSMLNWCAPIFVIIFSSLLLKERMPRGAPRWILLAFVGLSLILRLDLSTGGLGLPWLPVGMGFAGAAFGGAAYVAVRAATARVGVNVIILYFAAIAALLSAPFAFMDHMNDFNLLSRPELGGIVVMGLAASLGQWAMTQAYRFAAAGLVSTMSLMNAAFMSLFGWAVFHEALAPGQWIGMVVLGTAIGAIALGNSLKPGSPAKEMQAASK